MLVLLGSEQLDVGRIASYSKSTIDSELASFFESTKTQYRKTNPEVQFETSTFGRRDHLYKAELIARYKQGIDRRMNYFILPYCRVDVLIYSGDRNEKLVDVVSKIISKTLDIELPGFNSKKTLFSFPAH